MAAQAAGPNWRVGALSMVAAVMMRRSPFGYGDAPYMKLGCAETITRPCSRLLVALASPDLLVGKVEQAREHEQEREHLNAKRLALRHVRVGRPLQEGGDVRGFLRDRRGRAVGIGDAGFRQ